MGCGLFCVRSLGITPPTGGYYETDQEDDYMHLDTTPAFSILGTIQIFWTVHDCPDNVNNRLRRVQLLVHKQLCV